MLMVRISGEFLFQFCADTESDFFEVNEFRIPISQWGNAPISFYEKNFGYHYYLVEKKALYGDIYLPVSANEVMFPYELKNKMKVDGDLVRIHDPDFVIPESFDDYLWVESKYIIEKSYEDPLVEKVLSKIKSDHVTQKSYEEKNEDSLIKKILSKIF